MSFTSHPRKLRPEELARVDAHAFKQKEKMPICVVLDDVRSAMNVGSVFRSADAFCTQKIFLCGITPAPPHRDIEKSALGATHSVAYEVATHAIEVAHALRQAGYILFAFEQTTHSEMLTTKIFSPTQSYAFFFGNELHGVRHELLAYMDGIIEIPQGGTKHSLNVSVSAALALWTFHLSLDC